MATRFAGIFALVAFFTACGLGLVRGSAFDATIWHAVVSLWGFGAAGLLFGALAARAVEESIVAKRDAQTSELAGAKSLDPPRRERSVPANASRQNAP